MTLLVLCQMFWCDYGYNIKIGRHFFANHNTIDTRSFQEVTLEIMSLSHLTVDSILQDIQLIQNVEIKDWEYAYPITIGNNVWIGYDFR